MNFAYAVFNPRCVNPVTGHLFVEYRTHSLDAALKKLSKYSDGQSRVVAWNRVGRTISAEDAKSLVAVS